MTGKLAFAVLAVGTLWAGEGEMSPAERSYLVEQLESSKRDMLASIEGLTAAQWKFKPTPTAWSVQECAEHIILAEDFIAGGAKHALATPAVARLETSTAARDQGFVAAIKDRSKKVTAPEQIVPAGKFATPGDAAREFTARRAKTIEYAKTTSDELRTHVAQGPAGPMDAYQFMLLVAAHSARHTAQIREVEGSEGYPKGN